MKHVLVTGAYGFIGSAVCDELSRRNFISRPFDGGFDVTDKKQVFDAVTRADAVINLAGILGTAEIFGSEHRAVEVNILGAINVLDAAMQADVPVVQIATGHEGQPNPYAITKKCATDICLARAQYSGQKVNVVRAFHVYGPGQKMCAPHGKSAVRKIVPSFVARALTGMDIEINGSGMQKVDLVYVDDVARVLVDALSAPYGRKMDAGTGLGTQVIAVANDIVKTIGSKSKIVHVPMRVGEPENTVVTAEVPFCSNPWPYKLEDTVNWYLTQLRDIAVVA